MFSANDCPQDDSKINKNSYSPCQDRIPRCIVTESYIPLTVYLALHPDALKTMVRQLLQCIHDLRYQAYILHRDVSVSNIMYTKRDGGDFFILTGFEHAVKVAKCGRPIEPIRQHEAGTLAFTAHELVYDMSRAELSDIVEEKGPSAWSSSVVHCVRMDYESLALVAIWCATLIVANSPHKIAEEEERYKTHLREWEVGRYRSIASIKWYYIAWYHGSLHLSPLFSHLHNWFGYLLNPFRRGFFVYKGVRRYEDDGDSEEPALQESFEDYETLCDMTTLATILASLDKYDRGLERQAQRSRMKQGA